MRASAYLPLLLFLFTGSAAQAEVRGLFTIGLGRVTFDDGTDEITPTNVYLRGGAALNRYLEAGLELALTVLADEINDVDFDVNTGMVFLQGNLPIRDTLTLYVIGGPAITEVAGTSGGASADTDDNDIAVGGGVRFTVREDYYVVVDYIRYFDDDEFDGFEGDFRSDSINIGVGGFF